MTVEEVAKRYKFYHPKATWEQCLIEARGILESLESLKK